MGEGDDLGVRKYITIPLTTAFYVPLQDTLSGSTTILAHFSEALAQYAIHEQGVRR